MTTPNLHTLPPELTDKVLQYLTHPELKAVNRVNRALWERASARLWSILYSIDPLFRLITGLSIFPRRNARPEAWERAALIRRLPKNLKRATWERFEKYRYFVRILYVGRCVLPPSLYACLWKKKEAQELLPHLHTLFVSPTENQEWQWNPCANDVEDNLLLFLNSSVRRFASSCDQHAIVPSKILDSAPNMEELRLGASELMIARTECALERQADGYDWQTDPDNKGVYVQQDVFDWPQAMANLFSQWRLLSSLVLNGYFICTLEVLEHIARIPTLTEFGICRPEAELWADLGQDPAFFARLVKLSLSRTTPERAMNVYRCASLLRGVKSLVWDITRVFYSNSTKSSEDASLAVETLAELVERSHLATSLGQIRISDLATVPPGQSISRVLIAHTPIWSRVESIGLLAPLRLCRLDVEVDLHFLEYDATPMHALLSLGPQLSHLSMRGVIVPTQVFTMVADIYPLLDYLRCQMDMAHIDADFLEKNVDSLDRRKREKSHIITLHLAIATRCPPAIQRMPNRAFLDSPYRAILQLTRAWHPQSIALARDEDVEQCEHALRSIRQMGGILQRMAKQEGALHYLSDLEAEESRVEAELQVVTSGNTDMEREYIVIDDDDDEMHAVVESDDDVEME